MIVGDGSIFAIESGVTLAYKRLSFRALGFFVLHVGGRSYGVRAPDATMLACSFDEVGKRIAERGTHTAAFSTEADARRISDAFREAVYADEQKESYLGIPLKHFTAMIRAGRLDWAPDGDEAFDDGSYVLQFDVGSRVRLIAFTSTRDCRYDSDTLRDVWLAADDFYAVLQQWYDAFHAEWESVPKSDDSAGPTVLHG